MGEYQAMMDAIRDGLVNKARAEVPAEGVVEAEAALLHQAQHRRGALGEGVEEAAAHAPAVEAAVVLHGDAVLVVVVVDLALADLGGHRCRHDQPRDDQRELAHDQDSNAGLTMYSTAVSAS